MTFNNIIENIKLCNGGIINLIYDDKTVCNEFLMCITNELEDYNVIDPKDETDTRFSKMKDLRKILKNKVGKNIVFINQNNQARGQTNYGEYLELIDSDTILFILSNYYTTTNTQLSSTNPVYNSSVTILLKNKKINVLKSRISFSDDKESLSPVYPIPLPDYNKNRILDLNQIFRKSKLKTLIKK